MKLLDVIEERQPSFKRPKSNLKIKHTKCLVKNVRKLYIHSHGNMLVCLQSIYLEKIKLKEKNNSH